MAFWKRDPAAPAQSKAASGGRGAANDLAAALGKLPCTESHCGANTGVACEYVDRRNRHCHTAWCPNHRLVIDGKVYCRRHAGVITALPETADLALPDLENRAPSLVNWVARDIDSEVCRMLLAELDESSGAQLVTDPVRLIFVGPERARAWERSWKLAVHTGLAIRVSLQVFENADSEIDVRVNSNSVDRLAPPWIAQRGESPPNVDAGQRQEFVKRILEAIARGVSRENALTVKADREHELIRGMYDTPK